MHHPFFPLYVGLPTDSLKKFKLSTILIFETFCTWLYYSELESKGLLFLHEWVIFLFLRQFPLSFKWICKISLSYGNPLCFIFLCVYFVSKSLPLFFALIQGFYLNFSIIQYWYNVFCHSERSFRIFMTFVDTVNHSGWQFFPVWSIILFHLCLFYW